MNCEIIANDILSGFLDLVTDNCTKKRVVHLIKHSKNFNRAINIIVNLEVTE